MKNICEIIHQLFGGMKQYAFPFNEKEIPENGIYILFEKGECAHSTKRIVRVGTHTGDGQLRSRLVQHFLTENKDRSIFRKNIGRALLNKDNDIFLKEWDIDLTSGNARELYSGAIDLVKQREIENRVTTYIQNNFSFVVFQVDDKNKRLYLESRIISTVSLCNECKPSPDWLGLSSPKNKIKESGLWLVNELWKTPLSSNDIIELRDYL